MLQCKAYVYFLDFIANFWRMGTADIEAHREEYVSSYYGRENAKDVGRCLKNYSKNALAYGECEDEHAGEQFSNHVARILISQYMRDEGHRAEELLWATKGEGLREQIWWYQGLCRQGKLQYQEYLMQCERTALRISEDAKRLFEDSLLLQAKIYTCCYQGAFFLCESLLKAMAGEYQKAFYFAGRARREYQDGNLAMRLCEHGKWHGFYENECLADVKQTAWVLKGLMAYLRNLGDGPHFYEWQRELLYTEEDRRVLLILNMENHLEDEEIFKLMDEKWGE